MSETIETTTADTTNQNVSEETSASSEQLAALELNLLKERATQMGISFHPSIGLATLRAKVAAAINTIEVGPAPAVAPVETEEEKNMRLRREAHRLIRVIVSCLNPVKSQWEGELFTVSNSVVGTVKKYVPFNLDAGYHIPYIMLEMLKEKKYQSFYTVVDPRTKMKIRKSKTVPEFSITELPPLTAEQLKELATQQALNNSID